MNYYDRTSEGYDALHEEEQLGKLRIIDREATITGLILDVGAGTCIAAKYFAKKGKQVISLDPSAKLLKQGKGITIVGKAEAIPFKDRMFNTVISLTALHHCDLEKALREIKRVARDDATIAISFLKQSPKLQEFEALFEKIIGDKKKIDAEKDFIYIKRSFPLNSSA